MQFDSRIIYPDGFDADYRWEQYTHDGDRRHTLELGPGVINPNGNDAELPLHLEIFESDDPDGSGTGKVLSTAKEVQLVSDEDIHIADFSVHGDAKSLVTEILTGKIREGEIKIERYRNGETELRGFRKKMFGIFVGSTALLPFSVWLAGRHSEEYSFVSSINVVACVASLVIALNSSLNLSTGIRNANEVRDDTEFYRSSLQALALAHDAVPQTEA